MKLSSDTGNNVKAAAWGGMALFAPVIANMPEGWERTGLISLFCICMTAINWRTAGSGLTAEDGQALKERVLNQEDERIQDVLKRGRR
jgi:hypothetical protein